MNNKGCDTTQPSSCLKFKQMLIHFAAINLQLDSSKTHPEKGLCKQSPSRTHHRHWGILQDLVLDKRALVLVAELDTAGGGRHREGHCDDTRRENTTIRDGQLPQREAGTEPPHTLQLSRELIIGPINYRFRNVMVNKSKRG